MKKPMLIITLGLIISSALSAYAAEELKTHRIIFIHGYTGHFVDTWTNDETNFFWPEKISSDLGIAATTYHYPTYPDNKDSPRINILSKNFKEFILYTLKEEKIDQLYIIAHSYGGVVSLGALRLLFESPNIDEKLAFYKVKGIFLMGTPFEGRTISKLVKMKYKNPQLFDVDRDSAYTNELRSSWQDINRITRLNYEIKPWIFSVAEGKNTFVPIFKLIPYWTRLVPINSMLLSEIDGFAEFRQKNHVTLVKPRSFSDPVYLWVKGQIEFLLKNIPISKNSRLQLKIEIEENLRVIRLFNEGRSEFEQTPLFAPGFKFRYTALSHFKNTLEEEGLMKLVSSSIDDMETINSYFDSLLKYPVGEHRNYNINQIIWVNQILEGRLKELLKIVNPIK